MSKRDEMKKIRDEVFELKESPLYIERIENKCFPVIGEGSHDAKIIFIGEAPGKNEAQTGRPFCGASGKILDQLLDHVQMKREDVYITNIVKDRPTNNRDPKLDEIKMYAPFLIRQIETIQPMVIATLGRFSMAFIMEHFGLKDELDIISKLHGQIFKIKTNWGEISIVPLYHPAVAVYNRTQLNELKKDIEKIHTLLV